MRARPQNALCVYYDGDCPLCRREIEWIRARTRARAIELVDFAVPGFDFDALGVDRSVLMGRIHARTARGEWITGLEVFRQLYAEAGLGWMWTWTRWPGLEPLAERTYDLFARNRLRLTGRTCSADAQCRVDPAASHREHGPHRLERTLRLSVGVDVAFAFFCDPHNLERITPPALRFRITELPDGPLREGSEIRYAMRLHGVPFRWRTRIAEWEPDAGFVDEAIEGPYAVWRHRHILRPRADGQTEMIDQVEYRLPFGRLGNLFAGLVRRELEAIFDYRERAVELHFRTGGAVRDTH